MTATIALAALLAGIAQQPQQQPSAPAPAPAGGDREVVVTGERIRGSAIGTVPPVATLDADALHALGVSTVKEMLQRLKGLTASGGGGEPVPLLNGRRISGWQELYDIPFEAIERTEILPEEEASRFGYPPTVRVMNFITRKHFRAASTLQLVGTTTEGGGGTDYTELAATQIEGDRRTAVKMSYFRQDRVWQGSRDISPDPVTRFALPGNVAAAGGASIDPRLDALAGQAVTIAAVPGDPARRGTLAAYVAGANRPAVTDTGRWRTLIPTRDTLQASGTIALPLGREVSGSLNLAMEAQRSAGANGWAGATLTVPGGGGALPFAAPVTLYRYLPEAPLRQRATELKLHAGGMLGGRVGSWHWIATAGYDRVRSAARAEQGVPLAALQQAIDAGGDPFAVPAPGLAAARIADRSSTHTGTGTAQLVVNGAPLRVPAGPVQVTLTADYAHSDSAGVQTRVDGRAGDVTRTTRGARIDAAVPIAARAQGVLPWLGRLGVRGGAGVTDITGAGLLLATHYGANWSPLQPLQLGVTRTDTRTAPEIATLTAPTVLTPNFPLFDFATGRDALVTLVTGGNPALAPARQRSTRWSASLRPLRKADWNLALSYTVQRDRGGTVVPGATALLETLFPDRFLRDAAGRLVQVDQRPVNIVAADQRRLQADSYLSLPIGARKLPGKPEPAPVVMLFGSLTGSWRLEDRVTPRRGVPAIDLLDGGTLGGTGAGRARWELTGNVGASIGALNVSTYAEIQGPQRVRDPLPASDLRFSGRTWLVFDARADLARIVAQPWTRQLTMNVTVENVLNDRTDVRDATGAVPNRFQPAYLDPLGRSIRLGVRKLF